MVYKRYILLFIYSFFICFLVCLAIDLRADFKKVTGISLIVGITITLLVLNFEKGIKRWYRKTFDKTYKYKDVKPIVKENKTKEKDK